MLHMHMKCSPGIQTQIETTEKYFNAAFSKLFLDIIVRAHLLDVPCQFFLQIDKKFKCSGIKLDSMVLRTIWNIIHLKYMTGFHFAEKNIVHVYLYIYDILVTQNQMTGL